MPKFTKTDHSILVTSLDLNAGATSRLHFHAEQKAADPVISSSPAEVATAKRTALFDGPKGVWTVDVTGNKAGKATVVGEVKGTKASLTVTVTDPPPTMSLLAENTDAGLISRLLLSEVTTPAKSSYDAAIAKKSMQWMHLVVHNRLKNPTEFGAKKGAGIADIVKAKGQFAGFEAYPKLAAGVKSRISSILTKANDNNGADQAKFRQHVQLALDVASSASPIADPSPNGLIGWRKSGSGSPGPRFDDFSTSQMGNQFFQWKASTPTD